MIESQIIPHLGATVLQKLKPSHIANWHDKLIAGGDKDGQPLSSRTVGHAHRVLHRALARAAAIELVSRNVASFVKPPKVDEMDAVLTALKESLA